MSVSANQASTYQIGSTTFIVTPIYQTERGETILEILLKLMKAEIYSKK